MPTVFISYRHESNAHRDKVRALAMRLRAAGIDVTHDGLAQEELFHGNQPPNGWGLWSIQQATNATSVIIIGSEGWFRVINSPEPTSDGKGAAAEATCVFGRLFGAGAANDFAVIGFFDYANDLKTLPTYLETKCGRFDLAKDTDIARLITWLNRPIAAAPVVPATPAPAPTAATGPDFPHPVKQIDRSGFVDCRPAFEAFERLLHHDARHRVLLLEAEGEHGKSSLIGRFWHYAQHTLPPTSSAFVTFPEIPGSVDSHLGTLADLLASPALAGANSHEKSRSLLASRAALPTLIFIDHFERAQPEHADWLSIFLNRTIAQPLLRVVIAGRRVPAHLTQPWGIYTEHVHCDPFTEPDAFVQHAAACGSTMPPGEITACCTMMRSQRDSRKQSGQPVDGLSPLALLTEIQKRRTGGTAV